MRNMSEADRKMPKTILDLNDLMYYGKKVLMRVDFNVSINNDGIIGEDYRIRMTIPRGVLTPPYWCMTL